MKRVLNEREVEGEITVDNRQYEVWNENESEEESKAKMLPNSFDFRDAMSNFE